MTPEQLTYLIRQTLIIALEIASPFLFTALIIGFIISLLQTVTNIHEMTLSFVPKILAIFVLFIVIFPWMLKILTKFTCNVLIYQWDSVTSLIF